MEVSVLIELNEEIKLTLNTMQTDINEDTFNVMQNHLVCLLGIKRNELQKRLTERSSSEPDTHEHPPYINVKLDGQVITGESKQLTVDELWAGGWWCADTNEEALKAFKLLGLKDAEYEPWNGSYYACFLYEDGKNLIDRGHKEHINGLKQIYRSGSEFYWSEK